MCDRAGWLAATVYVVRTRTYCFVDAETGVEVPTDEAFCALDDQANRGQPCACVRVPVVFGFNEALRLLLVRSRLKATRADFDLLPFRLAGAVAMYLEDEN